MYFMMVNALRGDDYSRCPNVGANLFAARIISNNSFEKLRRYDELVDYSGFGLCA